MTRKVADLGTVDRKALKDLIDSATIYSSSSNPTSGGIIQSSHTIPLGGPANPNAITWTNGSLTTWGPASCTPEERELLDWLISHPTVLAEVRNKRILNEQRHEEAQANKTLKVTRARRKTKAAEVIDGG
jgi:hypothetical protein